MSDSDKKTQESRNSTIITHRQYRDVVRKNEETQNENQRLKSRINQLESDLAIQIAKSDTLENEINEVKIKFKFGNQLDEQENQTKIIEIENKKLKEKSELFELQQIQSQNRVDNQKKILQKLKDNITYLEEKNQLKTNQDKEQIKRQDSLKDKNKQLLESNINLESLNQTHKEKIEENSATINKLEKQISDLSSENYLMSNKYNGLLDEINIVKESKNTIVNELTQKLDLNLKEYDNFRLNSNDKWTNLLEAEKTKQQKIIEEQKKENEESQNKIISQWENQTNQLKIQENDALKLVEQFNEKLKISNDDAVFQQKMQDTLNQENQSLKIQYEQLQLSKSNLYKEFVETKNAYEIQIKEMNHIISTKDSEKQKAIEQVHAEHSTSNRELMSQNEKLQINNQNLEFEIKNLNGTLSDLNQTYQQLRKQQKDDKINQEKRIAELKNYSNQNISQLQNFNQTEQRFDLNINNNNINNNNNNNSKLFNNNNNLFNINNNNNNLFNNNNNNNNLFNNNDNNNNLFNNNDNNNNLFSNDNNDFRNNTGSDFRNNK